MERQVVNEGLSIHCLAEKDSQRDCARGKSNLTMSGGNRSEPLDPFL